MRRQQPGPHSPKFISWNNFCEKLSYYKKALKKGELKKTGCFLAVVFLFVLLLPGVSPAGKEDLVGTKVVGDMRIEFHMEAPKKGMVMTSGKRWP